MKSISAIIILVVSFLGRLCAQDIGAGAGAGQNTAAPAAPPAVAVPAPAATASVGPAASPNAASAAAAAPSARPALVHVGGEGLPEYIFPASVKPGGLVRIYARLPAGIGRFSAVMLDGHDRTVSSAAAFPFDPSSASSFWAALLGVPSTLAAGEYRVRCTVTRGVDTFVHEQPLPVEARSFFSEEIPFNQSLTELKTVPDPKKTAQARELAAIVWSLHRDVRFETGFFMKPVEYIRVSGGYGDRRVYKYSNGKSETSVHEGMDYAQVSGVPVVACGQGRVMMAMDRMTTGNTVVIEHQPGLYSLYFHMSELDVKAGDVVEKGQVVGKVGATGLATGAHLHWEVDVMGVPVDPEAFFSEPILDKRSDLDSIFSLEP